MGHTSPLKIAPSYGGFLPSFNTWFLGPIRILNPNDISIGSAVFARFTIHSCEVHYCDRQTDRQIDRPTDHATRSVTTGRIYVRSTAMRPNNKWEMH